MSDMPVHQQRMRALLIAAQKRQQFDTLAEMRHIKMMVILSFLLEFECATAATLLDLLEIKSNAILTRMVKQRFIKLFRWQNSVVYVPTQAGKQWLLDHLDDSSEIERVQNSKIRRKIGGYSAEHDLLVQRAAIIYARQNARPDEQWRIFKPRKQESQGVVQDAQIVYTLGDSLRSIWIEVERTPKPPVEVICKVMATARNLGVNDQSVFLCVKQKIMLDYFSILVAIRELDMFPVECVQLVGAVSRHALQGADRFAWRELERIDVAMIDADGAVVDDSTDPLEVAFSQAFWLLAIQQPENDWKYWARRLANLTIDDGTMPTYSPNNVMMERRRLFMHEPVVHAKIYSEAIPAVDDMPLGPDDEDIDTARKAQAEVLVDLLGLGGDNPMRSASDLRRAEARYRAWLSGLKRSAMISRDA